MQPRKCCLHCPGTWTVSSQERDEHDCNLPTYIKGNLKVSSLKKYIAGEDERRERLRGSQKKPVPSRPCSVYDRFAMAKRFHAENLQHQPLPDKVDDSVFKDVQLSKSQLNGKYAADDGRAFDEAQGRSRLKKCHQVKAGVKFAPALGCKTPATKMDLAICWEAPVDPCYEPPWPPHIDGSDGGPAPAIFTLVQQENGQGVAFKSPAERFEAKFCNVKNRCKCNHARNHNCNGDDNQSECVCANTGCLDDKGADEKEHLVSDSNELCNNLNSVHISDNSENHQNKILKPGAERSDRRQPIHLRNCSPCQCKGERSKRPRSRSLHSAPMFQGNKYAKRNGLPTRMTVPRPRTPYARRNFCIDTLTPPFSVVEGCRDADYPEHWRLTSVYQQSYRNPRKYL